MTTTLLSLALSLLVAAQQPNVPISLKTEAIRVATVAIQFAQGTPTATPTFGSPIAPSVFTTEQTPISVDLKVNGSDGPLTLKRSGCIRSFVPTCEMVGVTFSSGNTSDSCGLTADGPMSNVGNFGNNGSIEEILSATTTTIAFTCNKRSDSVVVNLEN